MAFSELETKRIEKLVGGLFRLRTRPKLADQLRIDYAVKGHAVTVFEERPVDDAHRRLSCQNLRRHRHGQQTDEWGWVRRPPRPTRKGAKEAIALEVFSS